MNIQQSILIKLTGRYVDTGSLHPTKWLKKNGYNMEASHFCALSGYAAGLKNNGYSDSEIVEAINNSDFI